jgi:hypothetical protein
MGDKSVRRRRAPKRLEGGRICFWGGISFYYYCIRTNAATGKKRQSVAKDENDDVEVLEGG